MNTLTELEVRLIEINPASVFVLRADEVVSLVVGAMEAGRPLNPVVFNTIGDRMYLEKRGGALAALWGDEAFMDALDWNESNG